MRTGLIVHGIEDAGDEGADLVFGAMTPPQFWRVARRRVQWGEVVELTQFTDATRTVVKKRVPFLVSEPSGA